MSARLLGACLPALLLVLAPQAALGQTRGNMVPVVDAPTFQTTGQSLWGPGTRAGPIDVQINLVSQAWDESGSKGDIVNIEGERFGGEIDAANEGRIEISARLRVPGAGLLDVTYPVRVELRVPEPNSFRDGEEVSIHSSYTLLPGGSISTIPPESRFDLTGLFGMRASARVRVCVFSCSWIPLFPPISGEETPFTVLSMSADDRLNIPVLDISHQVLPHTMSGLETSLSGISGTLDLPRFPAGTTEVMGRSLHTAASHEFIDISLDLDKYFSMLSIWIPPLGAQTTNLGNGVKAEYHILDAQMPVLFTQHQEMKFDPKLQVELVFPVAVPYRITDGENGEVASGTSNRIRFAVGHSLHLTFPAGVRTPLSVTSGYELDNEFSARSEIEFGAGFTQKVGEFRLEIPRYEVIPRICDPTGITEECTPAVRSPSFDIKLGPLFTASQSLSPTHSTLFPSEPSDCTPGSEGCGRWTLEGFERIAGTLFALDPEDPVIWVSTAIESGLATYTGGVGTLTQTLTVENRGDVTLSLIQVADALTAQFASAGFTVNSVTSTVLTANAGFNGVADPNTLTGSDVLPVGGSGIITVNFSVAAGNIYHSAVTATGRSPIGTDVAAEASARFAVFDFEFTPAQVLAPGNGVIPALIRGTSNLDARQIDRASIRLDGIAPTSAREQRNGSLWNVSLQFERNAVWQIAQARLSGSAAGASAPLASRSDVTELAQEVLAGTTGRTLGDLRARVLEGADPAAGSDGDRLTPSSANQAPRGTPVVLPLTGRLQDGTPFMGEATIIVSEGT
jgi:hypothetical protein